MLSDSSADSAATSRSSTPSREHPSSDLSEDRLGKPTQPVIDFPTKAFGSTKRSFHASWYDMYPWLEYSQQKMLLSVFIAACFRLLDTMET